MKLYLSHSGHYDYETELYAPLKTSSLAEEHHILFPHDTEHIDTKAKDLIAQCDLVLAEVSHPSTGQGIELGWADSSNTPILCIYKAGARISGSLRFVAKEFLEYTNESDMIAKLQARLAAT